VKTVEQRERERGNGKRDEVERVWWRGGVCFASDLSE